MHWKIGSYWNLPILPIPSLPMPIDFYGRLEAFKSRDIIKLSNRIKSYDLLQKFDVYLFT